MIILVFALMEKVKICRAVHPTGITDKVSCKVTKKQYFSQGHGGSREMS